MRYTTLHPAVVGEVTITTIATTPKNTTPTTFRSINGFTLPSRFATSKLSYRFLFFPESLWAKGSSNSGGLSNISTSSHLHITSSNLHISSSHPHIFTSSHLHICSSLHLLIFTSAHLHIYSSSHLHILTSSHLHIFTSSHLHIFTSSHFHIPSPLLIFTSSHLHITSSHPLIFTSSHPHIFSSSHLHILTSSHPHIFTSILSCSLALLPSSFSFFSISRLKRGAVPTRRHETQPFRTKRGSIAKNWGKIEILKCRSQSFRTKWSSIAKK